MHKQVVTNGFRGQLVRASASLGLAAVFGRIANICVLAAIFAKTGTSGSGLYGVATLVGSAAAFVAAAGMSTYVTRQYAADLIGREDLIKIYRYRLLTTPLTLGIVAAFSLPRLGTTIGLGFVLICASVALDQTSETGWAHGRSTGKPRAETLCNTVIGVAAGLSVAASFLMFGGMTLFTAGTCLIALTAVRLLWSWSQLFEQPQSSDQTEPRGMVTHLRGSVGFAANDLLGLAYLRGDVAVLSAVSTIEQVGLYTAATAFINPVVQVGAAMNVVVVAQITRIRKSDTTGGEQELIARAGLFIGLCVAALLGGTVAMIVPIIYGSDAAQILTLTLVLSAFLSFRFLNFCLSSSALAAGNLWARVAVVGLAAVLSLVLNWIFDPRLGATGAAWITVVVELFITLAFSQVLRLNRRLLPVVIPALVSLLLLAAVTRWPMSVLGAEYVSITGLAILALITLWRLRRRSLGIQ